MGNVSQFSLPSWKSKYLPVMAKNGIIGIEINSIEPECLKAEISNDLIMLKKKHNISRATVLNYIAKSLGFSGGFAGFKQEYNDLKLYMAENGLITKADLFTHRNVEFLVGHVHGKDVKPRQLADRIFNSGLAIPKKYFSGYDFDFSNTLDDGWYLYNRENRAKNNVILNELLDSVYDDDKYKNTVAKINNADNPKGLDFFLGGIVPPIITFHWNLLSNFCFQMSDVIDKSDIIYSMNDKVAAQYVIEDEDKRKMTLLKRRLLDAKYGWVEIYKYNDSLAFLKGRDGEYDFIFKGQRDKSFIANSEVPQGKFYHWLYFNYKGWEEKDKYIMMREYESSKSAVTSTDKKILFFDYLKNKAIAIGDDAQNEDERALVDYFIKKPVATDRIIDGFIDTNVNGARLAVSNLVSIVEFVKLLGEDYFAKHIGGDDWFLANADEDVSMPASLSWSDVCAYIKAFGKKHKVDVRLLTFNEYACIRGYEGATIDDFPLAVSNSRNIDNVTDLEWAAVDSDVYGECDIRNRHFMKCRFKQDIEFKSTHNGLKICLSKNFAEYTREYIIRPHNMSGYYGDEVYYAANILSNNKLGTYKNLKIGLRLCYNLKQ